MTAKRNSPKGFSEQFFQDRAKDLAAGVFRGYRGHDGLFEEHRDGRLWLGFQEPDDMVFWSPKLNQVSSYFGRAFALNEEAIGNAATYSFDHSLNIFASVSRWILANGDGIVVLNWSRAFDMLRDCPRIHIDAEVRRQYYDHMKPKRMPVVRVRWEAARSAVA